MKIIKFLFIVLFGGFLTSSYAIEDPTKKEQNIKPATEWRAACTRPVSYTHLDVYKRQGL